MAYGGYKFCFVGEDDIHSDLKCPICLLVLRSPHLTDCCGDHFCESCITRIKTSNESCPKCRETSFNTMINKKVDRQTRLLPIYCVNSSKGCRWTGAVKDFDYHLNTDSDTKLEKGCQYYSLQCPLKCGKKILRKDLADHKTLFCLLRPFSCPYCSFRATFQEVSMKHYSSCQQYPLRCPNACTKDTISRSGMAAHLSVCPLQPVVCPYAEYGCTSTTLRCNHKQHDENAVHTHLEMVKGSHEKLQQLCMKLTKDVEKVKDRCEEISTLKTENSILYSYMFLKLFKGVSSVGIPLQDSRHKLTLKKGNFISEQVEARVTVICSEMGIIKKINEGVNDHLRGQLQHTVYRKYQDGKRNWFDVFTENATAPEQSEPAVAKCYPLVTVNILNPSLGVHEDHSKFLKWILQGILRELHDGRLHSVAIPLNNFTIAGFPKDIIIPTFVNIFNQYQFEDSKFQTDIRFLVDNDKEFVNLVAVTERWIKKPLITS